MFKENQQLGQQDHEISVLIADDDHDSLTILESIISTLGVSISSASDGDQAVEICKSKKPDLAVLDLMMPGLNGAEVCRWIREQEWGKLVSIMILTAKTDLENKVSAFAEGADEYLTKPYNSRELLARIKALLRVRQLNIALEEKNKALQQAQAKIVAQERQLVAGQLAGAAAHSLGQPLTAMKLNLYLLSSLQPTDSRFLKAVSSLGQDVDRMAEIVEKLRQADPNKTEGYFAGQKILELKT